MGFFEDKLPYAKKVKEAIGQPIALTLGQWAWESNYGKSGLAGANNLGGIKFTTSGQKLGATKLESGFAKYPSLDAFTNDYIRVLSLSYYNGVKDTYKTPSINDDVIALGKSPYAGGEKAAPEYAPGILKVISQYNLIKYDEALNVDLSGLNSNYDTNTLIDKAKASFGDKELLTIGAVVAGLFLVLFKR